VPGNEQNNIFKIRKLTRADMNMNRGGFSSGNCTLLSLLRSSFLLSLLLLLLLIVQLNGPETFSRS
jgi:hypothetical protein